jgi:hypothetical protein
LTIAIRPLAVAVALTSALAACGGSGFTYHSNQDEKLYFKLPDDWTVFDTDDFGEDGVPEGMWVRGFVAGPSPTIENVFTWVSDEPRGYVVVEELSVMERDATSLASLRQTHFGTDEAGAPLDPLEYSIEHPDELQVLGYDDNVVLDNGPHGVHIRVAVTPPGGDDTAIIDQTALVDAATSRRYVLSIGCTAECFEEHKGDIEEVIESWTLEPR